MQRVALVCGSLLLAAGCGDRTQPAPLQLASAVASASATTSSSAGAPVAPARPVLLQREGQAIARSPTEAALYVADEDHSALRRVELAAELTAPPPIADPPAIHFGDAKETHVDLPGRPAQVIVTSDRVLVTVRDPGLLLAFSTGAAPEEIGRVALPADAWGIAISPDGSSAYVTSAWTHKLSKVDLGAMQVAWSVDVAREPRGVTVTGDGKRLFVSHLVGADLTLVDVEGKPNISRVTLPADPLRTFAGDKSVGASLGYAVMLSPDGRRLFAARHALGALWSWLGNTTVDVLSTVTGEPVAASRGGKPFGQLTKQELEMGAGSWADHAGAIAMSNPAGSQPRAMIYRKKTQHLLLVSEGRAHVAELDAMSVAPAMIVNRFYRLGGLAPDKPTKIQIPPHCGAPSGIALSADEDVAWVYCRTTDNIVAVRLTPDGLRGAESEIFFIANGAYHDKLSPWGPFAYAKLPVAPMPEPLALGRRLFYDAIEPVMSVAAACAGCHPEGRDDGHVWREMKGKYSKLEHFRAGPSLAVGQEREPYGVARQTPMLVDRVGPVGPYGWHGESATLVDRIKAGFELHRIGDREPVDGGTLRIRAEPLAEFIRKGLVSPPREKRDLTDQERAGKAVFESPRTQCATCHTPKTDFTDRSNTPLRGFRTLPLFDEDPRREYRVPSLIHVGSSPPYYHDGSAPTLEDLVEQDKDRMGRTSHLTADERAALVAYLKTL